MLSHATVPVLSHASVPCADYLDLYLVHWPVPGKHVLAYQELESLQAEGKIKSIGVSNYVVEDLEEVCAFVWVEGGVG